jgi:hypothetical protein
MGKMIRIRICRPVTLPTAFTGAKAQMTPPITLKPGERDEGIANKFDPVIHDVDVEQLGFTSTAQFEEHWFITSLIKDGDIEIIQSET